MDGFRGQRRGIASASTIMTRLLTALVPSFTARLIGRNSTTEHSFGEGSHGPASWKDKMDNPQASKSPATQSLLQPDETATNNEKENFLQKLGISCNMRKTLPSSLTPSHAHGANRIPESDAVPQLPDIDLGETFSIAFFPDIPAWLSVLDFGSQFHVELTNPSTDPRHSDMVCNNLEGSVEEDNTSSISSNTYQASECIQERPRVYARNEFLSSLTRSGSTISEEFLECQDNENQSVDVCIVEENVSNNDVVELQCLTSKKMNFIPMDYIPDTGSVRSLTITSISSAYTPPTLPVWRNEFKILDQIESKHNYNLILAELYEEKFLIKEVPVKLSQTRPDTKQYYDRRTLEQEILYRLTCLERSEYIVKLVDPRIEKDSAQELNAILIFEHYNGGDVRWWVDGLRRAGKSLPVPFMFLFISSAIGALLYLHEGIDCTRLSAAEPPLTTEAADLELKKATNAKHRKVLHRNINPENFLVRIGPHSDHIPKIVLTGFDHACYADDGNYGVCEDAQFHAPEMKAASLLSNLNPKNKAMIEKVSICTSASDAFALGCTVWYLLTGKEWIEGTDVKEYLRYTEYGHLEWFPVFVQGLLSPKPELRWGVRSLIEVKQAVEKVVCRDWEKDWRLRDLQLVCQGLDYWDQMRLDDPLCLKAFHLNRRLGSSSEGPIDLTEHKATGMKFAVKHVMAQSKSNTPPEQHTEETSDATFELPTEAAMLLKVLPKHPGIIHMEEAHLTTNKANERTCHMVLEWCAGGDLAQFLDKATVDDKNVPEIFILHFIGSMIDILSFLHRQARSETEAPPIVHRDIKLENIFLRLNPDAVDDLPEIVLADFGIACFKDQEVRVEGTWSYMGPELVKDWEDSDKSNAKSAGWRSHPARDIYAFGMCVYALLTTCYYVQPKEEEEEEEKEEEEEEGAEEEKAEEEKAEAEGEKQKEKEDEDKGDDVDPIDIDEGDDNRDRDCKSDPKPDFMRLAVDESGIQSDRNKDTIYKLMKACLDPDPSSRLTAEDMFPIARDFRDQVDFWLPRRDDSVRDFCKDITETFMVPT